MRHRVFGKQLCVKEDHRRAMLRNLAAGLFEHGQIETTLPKAKAVQPIIFVRATGRSPSSRLSIMTSVLDIFPENVKHH